MNKQSSIYHLFNVLDFVYLLPLLLFYFYYIPKCSSYCSFYGFYGNFQRFPTPNPPAISFWYFFQPPLLNARASKFILACSQRLEYSRQLLINERPLQNNINRYGAMPITMNRVFSGFITKIYLLYSRTNPIFGKSGSWGKGQNALAQSDWRNCKSIISLE